MRVILQSCSANEYFHSGTNVENVFMHGGLTLEELHADICQDFIASVGDSDAAEYNFEMLDSNADGVVTLKEFLDLADTLINM